MKILAFDPSGNFSEGKGTSGWCVGMNKEINNWDDIKASDFKLREAYWFDHKELIEEKHPDIVVIESYRLFAHKSKQQHGSSLETPQLIGYLQMVAYELDIPVVFQDPSIKTRFTDEILVKAGFLEKKGQHYYFKGIRTNLHQRDAMRHFLYFSRFGGKKK